MVLRSTPVRAGQRFPEPLAPLPFNKRVRVWACKIRKPHTHVFVPTSHKVFLRNYGSRIKGHQTPGANYLFYPSLLLTIPLISIHKQFTNYIKFEHRFDTFDFYTKAISWNKEQLQLIWQMPISHFWYFFIKLLFQKGGWITSRPFPFVKQPPHSITPAVSSTLL